VSRIRPELRERLILYKRECYRVLSRAFSGAGLATQLAAPRWRRPLAQGALDVLGTLADLGGRGRAEDILARLPGVSCNTVCRRLSRLALRGVLRRRALGLYELPDESGPRVVA
jgi:hypothetical protein